PGWRVRPRVALPGWWACSRVTVPVPGWRARSRMAGPLLGLTCGSTVRATEHAPAEGAGPGQSRSTAGTARAWERAHGRPGRRRPRITRYIAWARGSPTGTGRAGRWRRRRVTRSPRRDRR